MNDMSDDAIPQLPVAGMDALMRAEIDMQISTAHAYPRRLSGIAKEIRDLVTMTPAAAAGCVYSVPRDGKAITGPSIRLAEILFSSWGNCVGGSRVTEVNRKEGYVESEGVFHDLQKNAKTVRRFRRRITNKQGRLFSDDMIIVTGQAAGAIAFRNAVLAGIPRSMWGEAYDAAEQVIRGDIKTLGERMQLSMKAMAAFGFNADEVYRVLGIEGKQDFSLDHIVTLTGLYQSLREGETTKEQVLRDLDAQREAIPEGKKPSMLEKAAATAAAKAQPEAEVVQEKVEPEKAAAEPEKPKAARKPKAAEKDEGGLFKAEDPLPEARAAAEPQADLPPFFVTVLQDLRDMGLDTVQEMHGDDLARLQVEQPSQYKRLQALMQPIIDEQG